MQKKPRLQFEGSNSQLMLPFKAELLYTIPGISTVAELHPPGQNVPLGQSPEQALELIPSAEPNLPKGQFTQLAWLLLLWYWPSGHRLQDWAPAELSVGAPPSNLPAGHSLQLCLPESTWYLPAGQRWQLVWLLLLWYWPARHW